MSNFIKSRSRLPLASAICLAVSVPAMAASDSKSDSGSKALEEVVVTAQRRMESEQHVPITMNVVSGEDLTNAGVNGTAQLTETVPSFRFDNNGTWAQPSIRGVGTALANVGGGSAVGIYIDGFLVPSPLTSDFSFLNVTNVQVLKGPQGTLFGRNTTAGAVLITTADPSFQPVLKAKLSYGNYNESSENFYGSIGLSDTVAADLAIQQENGDGFVKDIVTNDSKIGKHWLTAVRTGVLWTPTEDMSFTFRYSHSSKSDPKAYLFGALDTQPDALGALTIGAIVPGAVYGTTRNKVALSDGIGYKPTVDTGTLTAEFDFDWATLTSRTMYRDQKVKQAVDLDSTQYNLLLADLPNNDLTKTQEFILSGDTDRLQWVTGLFWMNDVNTQTFALLSQPAPPAVVPLPFYLYNLEADITSTAAFADATYEAVDDLYLDLGVRYSYEKNDGFWHSRGDIGKTKVSHSWSNVSPRFVVRYQMNPDSSVYGSISKGFKAGLMDVNGFNTKPIDPEKITAYEVGFKTQGLSTRFDASVFYYDYKDLQVSSYVGTYSFTTNAASTHIYGGELTFVHQFSDSFNLSGGVGYTHSEYQSYPTAPYHQRITDITNPAFGTFTYTTQDAKGNQMQRAPEWTGNLTATYDTQVAGGKMELSSNLFYTSKVYFDPANQYYQDGYALLNLRAAWTEPSEHWTFAVYGKNITDKTYINQVLPGPMAAQQTYGDPRTYGVSVSYVY